MSRTLVIDDGRLQREVILVGTMLVGRDPECEISHADPRLSRRHAEFRVTAEGVRLRDLGSRNGTHVNGRPIVEVVLRPGDTVQVAHLTIRFDDTAASQTVVMPRGARVGAGPSSSAGPPVEDDRTRVVAPADVVRAQPPIGLPPPAFEDDRTRVKGPSPPGPSGVPARLSPPTESFTAGVGADLGDVVIRERAALANPPAAPPDLSMLGLAGSGWGRHVLLQGVALAFLVLVLTGAPLLAWELRAYGNSALSSWPVLLPVVATAFAAGLAVASLIARTTARGLASQGR